MTNCGHIIASAGKLPLNGCGENFADLYARRELLDVVIRVDGAHAEENAGGEGQDGRDSAPTRRQCHRAQAAHLLPPPMCTVSRMS